MDDRSLDAFTRCRGLGCEWRVKLPETRCREHGGLMVPQYYSGVDGEILATRGFPASPETA